MASDQPHDHSHEPVNPDNIDWDEMYRDAEQRWSGHVNGSLVVEVEGLEPGRALDVGCGEGADAMWLAEHGWTVTAVDIAPTAIARATAESAARQLEIDLRAQDLLSDPIDEQFDLVSLQYPGFAVTQLDNVVSALTSSVAPGGLLLVVGHGPHPSPEDAPFDRTEWVQAEDIAARLPDSFTIETHETRSRPGEHHQHSGAHHMDDVIVRARRTG